MPQVGRSSMPIRTKIKDMDSQKTVDMDLESDNTVNDIIESVSTFWTKSSGAYVLRWNDKVLRGDTIISEVGIKDGDILELILDPQGG
jgi:uncharacterized ubiquitin-like protein YukD